MSSVPGMHIWYGTSMQDPKLIFWSFQNYEGGEEHKILKKESYFNFDFIVKELRTREEFDMHISESNHIGRQHT